MLNDVNFNKSLSGDASTHIIVSLIVAINNMIIRKIVLLMFCPTITAGVVTGFQIEDYHALQKRWFVPMQ